MSVPGFDRTVARNFAALGAGEAAARLIAFAATIYIARVLGPSLFGAVGVALAVLLYCNRIVDGGLELGLGVREIAAEPGRLATLVPVALTWRLAIAGLLILLLIVTGVLWLPQPEGVLLALYSLTLFPVAAGTRWVHLGFDRSRVAAVATTLGQLAMAAAVLLLVHQPGQVARVPMAQFAGDMLAALLLLSWFRRRGIRFRLRFDPALVRPLLPRAWFLVLSALLGITIYNSDMLFLRVLHDRSAVGQYAAAYTIVTFFLNLGTAYSISLLPWLTRLETDGPRQQELYHNAMAQLFAAGLPLALGGTLVASRLMPLIFGGEFRPSAGAFALLIWCLPLCLLRDVPIMALVARRREHRVLHLTAAAAGLNLLLNALLIPRWSMAGAAAATVVTEGVRMVLALAFVRPEGFRLTRPARFWRPLVAGGLMALLLLATWRMSVWLVVPLGALVYAAGLTFTGGLRWRRGMLPALTV